MDFQTEENRYKVPKIKDHSSQVIIFDGPTESFHTELPSTLHQRVHPDVFSQTLHDASQIVQYHMKDITLSNKGVIIFTFSYIAFVLVVVLTSIIGMQFVIRATKDEAWALLTLIPLVIILSSVFLILKKYFQYKKIHGGCKDALMSFLAQENDKYRPVGVEWQLIYDLETLGKCLTKYKFLATQPSLILIVDERNLQVKPTNIPAQPIMIDPTQLIYPTIQQENPIIPQPNNYVSYQSMNPYSKGENSI